MAEQLARPFSCDLQLLSEDHGIKLESILGQSLTVRFNLPQQGQRFFNGYVSQFSYSGSVGRYAAYTARVSPWLWFLSRISNCRIFQNKTVPDIVKEVFQKDGFADFEDRLGKSYRSWEYCVQYRETDFNFVSRLCEQEGIYYRFSHEDGRHTLILCDGYASHDRNAGYEQVPYYPPDVESSRERDHVSRWSVAQEVQPGAYVLRDWDFQKPKANLESRLVNPCQHANAEFEVYDYPGIYLTSGEGDTCSRIRLEELQSDHEEALGEGDVAGLSAGCLFSLQNCPRDDQNREYLVISATLDLLSEEYESAHGGGGGGVDCQCGFTVIDSARSYRPPRLTPKPVVQGPQTAIVTGPPGEEIWCDQYGRVKVQFHWDREGKRDENSSCWVRVSHPWAGKNWGAVAIPRIGQEVIVDFLEGDPDRPIITGRVYNADTMPPYGLPAGNMISGLKSDSTKGGGGYNEYVMDDTKGNELIREHAQFNKDSTIEHDDTQTVKNNRTITVDGTHTETIKKETSITITQGNYIHKVSTGTETREVKGNIDITSHASINIVAENDQIELHVGASKLTMKADGTIVLSGKDISILGSKTVKISGDKVESTGNIEATIGVGTQTLTCDKAKLQTSGASISHSAVGTQELTGALIKIN